MKKLGYLGAMAILGSGLTMAQSASTPSDPSNSTKSAQTGTPTANGTPNSGVSDQTAPGKPNRRQPGKVRDTTVRDQQSSTTSTTGASGQSDSRPSSSTVGTAGSTPGTENSTPADNGSSNLQSGTSTDQQPNSSSNPSTPTPHLVMNETPAARAVATHTPDPGTCMNPAAVQTGQYPSSTRNCD